jgi:hypothetical protein
MDRVEHDRPVGNVSTTELGGKTAAGVRRDRNVIGAQRFSRRGDQDEEVGAAPADLDTGAPRPAEVESGNADKPRARVDAGMSHGGQRGKPEETPDSGADEKRQRTGSQPRSGGDGGWAPEID